MSKQCPVQTEESLGWSPPAPRDGRQDGDAQSSVLAGHGLTAPTCLDKAEGGLLVQLSKYVSVS